MVKLLFLFEQKMKDFEGFFLSEKHLIFLKAFLNTIWLMDWATHDVVHCTVGCQLAEVGCVSGRTGG
jgi:hypothetical protein